MAVIYNHYYNQLKITAIADGNSPEDADDIVSGLLATIFANAANYNKILDPDAWMFASVRFAIIHFKQKNAKYVFEELIDETRPTKQQDIDFNIDLKTALEKLTERQRQVFQLHFIYDFSINDTAAQTRLSPSTVKRDLNDIRNNLKNFLER